MNYKYSIYCWVIVSSIIVNTNLSHACDEQLADYLEQAKSIAVTLPEDNAEPEHIKQYDDQYWIRDPVLRKIGGYRYVIHDIAVTYAKIGCWDKATQLADSIQHLGIKDSAWAQIAIEYAKNDSFDEAVRLIKAIKYPTGGEIARKYVAKELVRVGRLEEGRKLLRGAGIFGNRYNSYFYQHAMNLAHSGKHKEAIKYVNRLEGMRNHVRNAFGDMLLVFQERNDIDNATKIISYYEDTGITDVPNYQISIYYQKKGLIDKAYEYTLKLKDPQRKTLRLLELAALDDNELYYKKALDVIDKEYKRDPEGNWTIITHTASHIYSLKGQDVSNQFIHKYLDKNDYRALLSHKQVVEYLFTIGQPEKVTSYLKRIDGILDSKPYIAVIARIRANKLTEIPDQSIAENNGFIYRGVLLELLKSGYPEDRIIQAINANYVTEHPVLFIKSELLNITAMVASQNLGPVAAAALYQPDDQPLLYAYWLIGIAQKNQADEIHHALKYKLHL